MNSFTCVVCNKNLQCMNTLRKYDNSFCSSICIEHIDIKYSCAYKNCVKSGEYYCSIGNCQINVTLFKLYS